MAKTFLREILVYQCGCGWREIIPPDDAIVAEHLDIGIFHRIPEPAREKQCPDCRSWITGKKESWNGPDFPKQRKRIDWMNRVGTRTRK